MLDIAAVVTPRAWTRREAPGKTYPLVFTRDLNGRTYRIAPDTFEKDRWTVDIMRLGYERHTDLTFATPADAARWMRDPLNWAEPAQS